MFIEVCVQIEKRSSLCCDECLFIRFPFKYTVNINWFFFPEILVKENARLCASPFKDIVCACFESVHQDKQFGAHFFSDIRSRYTAANEEEAEREKGFETRCCIVAVSI